MKRLLRSGSRMALMSAISFGVNLGLFALFVTMTGMPPELSAAVAVIIVMGLNFTACKYWIFDARGGNLHKQLMLFVAASLVFRGAEIGLLSLVYRLTYLNELAVYSMVLAISFLVKFFYFEKTVFGKV